MIDAVAAAFFAAFRHALITIDRNGIEEARLVWQNWHHKATHAPFSACKPRLLIVARILTVDDIVLHGGMLQLIALDRLQPLILFVVPTFEMAEILRSHARRQGWVSLVSIITESELDHSIRRFPGNTPVAIFPLPAMIPLHVINHIFRSSANDDFIETFSTLGSQPDNVFLGSVRNYPGFDAIAEFSLNQLLSSFARRSFHDSNVADRYAHPAYDPECPCTMETSSLRLMRELWIRSDEVEFLSVHDRELLTITIISEGAEEQTIAVQSVVLSRQPDGLHLPILPRHASQLERTMSIRMFDGPILRTKQDIKFSVPPANIAPWMLSAFLNRGGGGNPVIKAFAAGTGCRLAYAEDEPEILQDIPVVWGVLRGSDRILAQAQSQRLHFFYIDHAYFDRGHGNSYRISRSRFEAGPVRKVPDDRVARLNLDIRPWRKKGRSIVVCPPTDYFMAAHDCADWLETTLRTLRLATDRPIIVREKPKPGEVNVPLARALRHAHALVTHSSNVAIEAACLGTPVFVSGTSAAAPVGQTDLGLIETPIYPERDDWLAHLAYSQYSMAEIQDGTAWNILKYLEDCEFV